MEQPSYQQFNVLPDQLFRRGRGGFPHCGLSEPTGHVFWWSGGDSDLRWVCLGRREQGHHQELQKEEPHSVCAGGHGHQLLCALSVRRRPGLHLWHYVPPAAYSHPCVTETPQHEEPTGEQDGGCRDEEDPDGRHHGPPGPAGRESEQNPGLHREQTQGIRQREVSNQTLQHYLKFPLISLILVTS